MAVSHQQPGSIKLHYFNLPGRAETTRLILKLGKVPHEDVRVTREEWPALKPKTPLGQLPVLEVDGKYLPQSGAIERYTAKLAGLYPTDPWEAALVDSKVALVSELMDTLIHTFYIKDAEEKLAARKAVIEGALGNKLAKLDSILAEVGPTGWLAGSSLSYADLAAFVALCSLVSGFFDGVPPTLYDPYPNVAAYRKRIASLPEIKAYYELPLNSDAGRNSFRP